MKWSIFFVNILIHVGVMALFLTIFFFTIAQYFEKKIIENQIDFVIDNFVGNSLKSLPKDKSEEFKQQINNAFDKQDLSKDDEKIKKENKNISTKAWIFVGTLSGIILFITVIIGFIYKWEIYYLKFLFHSSLISLVLVAITETLFMFLIAQNYLSADPNQIKSKIVDILYKNRCSSGVKDCII